MTIMKSPRLHLGTHVSQLTKSRECARFRERAFFGVASADYRWFSGGVTVSGCHNEGVEELCRGEDFPGDLISFGWKWRMTGRNGISGDAGKGDFL